MPAEHRQTKAKARTKNTGKRKSRRTETTDKWKSPIMTFNGEELKFYEMDFIQSAWKPMGEKNCIAVQLRTDSPEFRGVACLFLSGTAKNTSPQSHCHIQRIMRIQNEELLERYLIKFQEMQAYLGGASQVNEVRLLHGTSSFNVDSICYEGFDTSRTHKLGRSGCLGIASYFSWAGYFSSEYCKRDIEIQQSMPPPHITETAETEDQSTYSWPGGAMDHHLWTSTPSGMVEGMNAANSFNPLASYASNVLPPGWSAVNEQKQRLPPGGFESVEPPPPPPPPGGMNPSNTFNPLATYTPNVPDWNPYASQLQPYGTMGYAAPSGGWNPLAGISNNYYSLAPMAHTGLATAAAAAGHWPPSASLPSAALPTHQQLSSVPTTHFQQWSGMASAPGPQSFPAAAPSAHGETALHGGNPFPPGFPAVAPNIPGPSPVSTFPSYPGPVPFPAAAGQQVPPQTAQPIWSASANPQLTFAPPAPYVTPAVGVTNPVTVVAPFLQEPQRVFVGPDGLIGPMYVIMARVLLGRWTYGLYTDQLAPRMDRNDPQSPLCDSTFNTRSGQDYGVMEFGIFNSSQIYPEYIIEFRTIAGQA